MANQTTMFGTKAPVYDDRIKFFFIRLFMKFGMKNPYEVKKPEFSPELLRDKAKEMREIRSKSDYYKERLRYLVGDLETLWQNDIQSSLTAELGSLQNSLLDYSDLLEEYASFLDFAAQELPSRPEAVRKYTGDSEENDEPVIVVLSHIPDLKRPREDIPADTRYGIQGMIHTEPDKSFVEILFRLLAAVGIRKQNGESKTQVMLRKMKFSTLEMRSAITQFNFFVRKMQYLVEELKKLWQTEAQTTLFEELDQMESPVKDFSNVIDEYATLLDMTVLELESNVIDVDKASVFADAKDGPVNISLSNISYLKRSRIDLKAFDPYFERTQTGVSTVITASRKNAEYIYNVYEDHIELVKYIGLKRQVEVPSQIDGLPVTHIGLDCFAMAWRVRFTSITIPESVTTIYHGAFRGCSYLREIKLPESLKYIGNYAFAFITDLEHIDLPSSVAALGMGAFRNCDGLREIVIPDSTLRIGNDCFYTCKSLGKVVIGDGVIDIDDWAFRQCEHLASVTIGSGVTKIGESAFYDDVLLMRLDIPANVENIGDNAFYQRRHMTIGVVEGSAAEKYAAYKNQQYVKLTSAPSLEE